MPDLDIIEISDYLAQNARVMASVMSEPQIRKRGMIDMLGINCAVSYLQTKKLRIDTKRSIHSIPILFEEFKITDIYYGNYRIDVITLYKEKTIKIPKIHADVNIMPNFYFVVQIGSKIKEAKMIGFIDAKNVLACSSDSKYYYPTLDLIFDLNKFISITRRSIPNKILLGKHADCLGLFLKFIDKDLSNVYKSQMIQHLMNCDSCRSRFIDTMEFEKIADNIRYYPNLAKKHEFKMQTAQPQDIDLKPNELVESLDKLYMEEDIPMQTEPSEIEKEAIKKMHEEVGEPQEKPKIVANNNKNKKAIDSIFKELRHVEMPKFRTIIKSKYRHFIIVLFIILFFLGGFALISIKGTSDILSENENMEDGFPDGISDISELGSLYDEDDENNNHQAKLITKQKDIEDFAIQQPVPSEPAYSPNVAKVSWEVPESLIKKSNYTKFLQLTGKNIKLNLQNDLLLVNDVPINRLITVNIKIASNGDVKSINLIQTSGSKAIDASINRVVKDTLKYMKPPSHGIIAKPVDASLTIELN